MSLAEQVRMTAWLSGRVQGVGMRWWIRSRALELGLVGHASNRADGRVEVLAEGARRDCEQLLTALRGAALDPGIDPPPGRVDGVSTLFSVARGGISGFAER